jgi:hypothetical protein
MQRAIREEKESEELMIVSRDDRWPEVSDTGTTVAIMTLDRSNPALFAGQTHPRPVRCDKPG